MNILSNPSVFQAARRRRLMAWLQHPNVKATAWTMALFAYALGLDAALDHIRLS